MTSGREVWRAPAKINLWLSIVGRRDDGYYETDTCYQAIALADTLLLEPAPAGTPLEQEIQVRVLAPQRSSPHAPSPDRVPAPVGPSIRGIRLAGATPVQSLDPGRGAPHGFRQRGASIGNMADFSGERCRASCGGARERASRIPNEGG